VRVLLATALATAVATMPAGAAAEPASQLQSPTGAFTGKPPRGYVITIHGGGWTLVGPGMMGFELAEDARLNSWGYATLNVDYRRGSPGRRER
jgi:acetyl esterase/lipase